MTKEQFEVLFEGKKSWGRTDGQFIAPRSEIDRVFMTAKGDLNKIEEMLGWKKGHFFWRRGLVRIDVDDVRKYNLRMATGNEEGAMKGMWRAGGFAYSKGGKRGVAEAIIDPIKAEDARIMTLTY